MAGRFFPAPRKAACLAAPLIRCAGGERADMRAIVDTFVAKVKNRQTADGWCLPYPMAEFNRSERSNYDRVGLTRGLIAAGMVGNPDAYGILRRFYDWFNTSSYQPTLLLGGNCNNGHEGGLLMYFSPVGKQEDLLAVEKVLCSGFLPHGSGACRAIGVGLLSAE